MGNGPATVVDLTQRFASCTECATNPRTFDRGVSPLLSPWCPPRGWAGTLKPDRRELMVVAFNPGAPMPDERSLYAHRGFSAGTCTPEQASALLDRCTRNYLRPREQAPSDTVFHRKSIGLARAALWLFGHSHRPDDTSWLDHVWFTDAFKCSTPSERGPRIPKGAMDACARHLRAELMFFQPKIILALGNRAHAALVGRAPVPVVKFRFPSGGLAAIDSATLDESFDTIAAIAGEPLTTQSRRAFAAYRTALRTALFP